MARKNPSSARVLIIGDAHDSPSLPDKSRFKWIAHYASENDIPFIRSVGDWATFDSCSQYENRATVSGRDKPSFEQDMKSLEASILAFRSAFKKNYRPNLGITLGNHEHRVKQWENDNPEVEGLVYNRLLELWSQAGFETHEYGEWCYLAGVGITHVPFNVMGRPYGGQFPDRQIASNAKHSCIWGHTHKGRGPISVPKVGHNQRIDLLDVGCALPDGHVERYALNSTTGWTYGVYDLELQDGLIQSHRFISMIDLEKNYAAKPTATD